MNCPTVELSEFQDGALPPARAAQVEKHVRECEECAARVKEERALKMGLLVLACPSANVLGRFLDGSLEERTLSGIRAHVERCAECSEVLEWTREGSLESAGELPKASGPRRRPVTAARRAERSNVQRIFVPLAAAAALFLLILFLLRETPHANEEMANEKPAEKTHLPEKTPRSPPPPTKKPEEKPAPPTETPPEENPVPTPPPPPEMPPVETPPPPPAAHPDEQERSNAPPAPTKPPEPGSVGIARATGDLKVGPSREKAVKISGNTNVAPTDIIFATLAPGSFEVAGGAVILGPATEARLEAARLLLEKGESYSESSLELSCKGASAKPDGAGAQLLLRTAPKGAQLYVCAGKATFSSAGGQVSVSAGEASEVESDAAPTRPHKAEPSTWLAVARAERNLAFGLDYPRGFLAEEAARALKDRIARGPILERARALHAVEAARASDERFARIATEVAGTAADASFDEIVARADALSAPEAALAVLARSRRLPAQRDALAKSFAALAKIVEKTSPADLDALAKDADSLLVLKWFEKAGARIKGLRERVQVEAVGAPDDLDWLARATLAGAAPDDLDVRFKRLDQALGKDAVVPANRLSPLALLAYERAQATAGRPALDDGRFFKVLEHLAAAGAKPCAGSNAAATLLVLSRDAHVLCGRAPAPPQESVSVLLRKDGKLEVTIVFESPKRPRSVFLGGSWDGWAKDKEPMARRNDGSFVETLVLPRGRYVYKLRLENGVWEADARNPLYEFDGKSGQNSVLMLE